MSTVIADVKNRRMLSDKKMTLHATSVAKVFKVKGYDGEQWLVGGVGSMTMLTQFVEWFKDTTTATETPSMENTQALALNSKGQLFLYYATPYPIHIRDKWFAIGSGGEYAVGALEAGATPEQALRIATKRDANTGNGKLQVAL